MPVVGYSAALEQFHPSDLLRWCREAEEAGFGGVMAADHFHPWTPTQGQSPFVWSWMGALGLATQKLTFGPGVTCASYRYHPAIIAQAAATLAAMYPGRFWLGIGTGEALNEHVVGGEWPEAPVRLERMIESIEIIKLLFSGKKVRYSGKHLRMESARLYTRPETPPPILVAASGPKAAETAGRLGDGLITPAAPPEKLKMLLERFEKGAREAGKDPSKMPRLLQLHVSWAPTREEAVNNALKEWPNGGIKAPKQDIRSPEDFEAFAQLVRPEDFQGRVLISPDLDEHRRHIQSFFDLGFDEVHVHNVGRDQSSFIRAYGEAVIPALRQPVPASQERPTS
ncbi:TIGR03557 family F420-dependent LLM class oxidoreductase [Thermogemmatispora sp.]|uniref:TIGR03557 family F420-dependent LLM class oxidoreductase n=1 Tax=Thermogemmatispora sp. TaxID=1968838 RepID=UPI0035E437B4